MFRCFLPSDAPEARGGWAPAFAAVVNGMLLSWPSIEAAAANKKPAHAYTLAGSSGGAERVLLVLGGVL